MRYVRAALLCLMSVGCLGGFQEPEYPQDLGDGVYYLSTFGINIGKALVDFRQRHQGCEVGGMAPHTSPLDGTAIGYWIICKVDQLAEQQQALAIVARVYEPYHPLRGQPEIVWHYKHQLPPGKCFELPGKPGFCVGGFTYPAIELTNTPCRLHMIWTGKYSTSSFAHEVLHCVMSQNGNVTMDKEHKLKHYWAWNKTSLVGQAKQALKDAGL